MTYLAAVVVLFVFLAVGFYYSFSVPSLLVIIVLQECFLLTCMCYWENETQNWRQTCRNKENEIKHQRRLIDEYKRRLVQDIEDAAAMSQ